MPRDTPAAPDFRRLSTAPTSAGGAGRLVDRSLSAEGLELSGGGRVSGSSRLWPLERAQFNRHPALARRLLQLVPSGAKLYSALESRAVR